MNPALTRLNARLAAKAAKRAQALRRSTSAQTRRDIADVIEDGAIRLMAVGFVIGFVVIVVPVAIDLLRGAL